MRNYKPFQSNVILNKETGFCEKITIFLLDGVYCNYCEYKTYQELLDNYVFEDGSPCGVMATEDNVESLSTSYGYLVEIDGCDKIFVIAKNIAETCDKLEINGIKNYNIISQSINILK